MDSILATAGLITAGALSPGPNNLVVMRLAAARTIGGVVRAVAGIVLGGLFVVLLVGTGVETLLSGAPILASALAAAVGVYLGWLGVRLILGGLAGSTVPDAKLPGGFAALFVFQLIQPGPWMLAFAAFSSLRPGACKELELPVLAALFVLIPTICLAGWSILGVLARRWMERPSTRGWFDGIVGTLLCGFAVAFALRILGTI